MNEKEKEIFDTYKRISFRLTKSERIYLLNKIIKEQADKEEFIISAILKKELDMEEMGYLKYNLSNFLKSINIFKNRDSLFLSFYVIV